MVTRPGVVDALAVWFDLLLDSQTSLSTAPSSPTSSWDQAVFPLCGEMRVEPGDEVGVAASCSDTQLQFQLTEVKRNQSGMTCPVQNGESEERSAADHSEWVKVASFHFFHLQNFCEVMFYLKLFFHFKLPM